MEVKSGFRRYPSGAPAIYTSDQHYRGKLLFVWVAFSAALGLVAVSIVVLGSSTQNRTPPLLNSRGSAGLEFPLEIGHDPVDLGILLQRESSQATLRLRNTQKDSLTLERIETSCPCLAITPLPVVVAPGESKGLTARLDLSSEPDFHGALQIDVTGQDAGGQCLFKTHVDAKVRPKPEQGEYPG